MDEREADLIMWQSDRENAVRKASWWPGFYFLPHGLNTPKEAFVARARGIMAYERELRFSLYPFGRK